MRLRTSGLSNTSQLNDYQQPDITEPNILHAYWGSHVATAPGLALMAKDILSVASVAVGVEQLVSATRQICGCQ